MSRPPRHQECKPCRERGHRCEALLYAEDAAGDQVPVCRECAMDEVCVYDRCHSASVALPRNIFGEVIEEPALAPVIRLTPEAAGMARTVPYVAPADRDVPYYAKIDFTTLPAKEPMCLPASFELKGDNETSCADFVISESVPKSFRFPEPEPIPETAPTPEPIEETTMIPKRTDGHSCAYPGCKHPAYDGDPFCKYTHGYKNPGSTWKNSKAGKAKKPAKTKKAAPLPETKIVLAPPIAEASAVANQISVSVPVNDDAIAELAAGLMADPYPEPAPEETLTEVWGPELYLAVDVRDTLSGFAKLGMQVGDLVERKNQAYGDSFSTAGDALRILYPNGVAAAQLDDALVLARVWDKLSRVARANDPSGESPWLDIAGYALLALNRQEKVSCASVSGSDAETPSKTTTDSAAPSAGA